MFMHTCMFTDCLMILCGGLIATWHCDNLGITTKRRPTWLKHFAIIYSSIDLIHSYMAIKIYVFSSGFFICDCNFSSSMSQFSHTYSYSCSILFNYMHIQRRCNCLLCIALLYSAVSHSLLHLQPQWTSDGSGIVFVGWENSPRKLGIMYCSNRRLANHKKLKC